MCVDWRLAVPQVPTVVLKKTTFIFFLFLSFNLLIRWRLSIWNCCKPFSSLLYNCQLLCFWQLALSVAVEVFPLPFSRIYDNITRKLVHTYIGYLKLVISQKTGTWTWCIAVSYLCIHGSRKQVQMLDSLIRAPSLVQLELTSKSCVHLHRNWALV